MHRRNFFHVTAGAAFASTAPGWAAPASTNATILYADRPVPLDRVRTDGAELWVRPADLPRINEFELDRKSVV